VEEGGARHEPGDHQEFVVHRTRLSCKLEAAAKVADFARIVEISTQRLWCAGDEL
jgi:hypothetical protein